MKKLLRTFRMATHALRRNVMRAILTTLGIIIGVAAVIAMMEIGSGSSSAIQDTIASMGANNLLVMPGTVFGDTQNHFRVGFGRTNMPEALARLEAFAERTLR